MRLQIVTIFLVVEIFYFNESIAVNSRMLKLILPSVLKDFNRGTLLGLIMQGYRHENVSLECQASLGNLSAGLNAGDLKAALFTDASAKLEAGMGLGTLTLLGSLDQCLKLDYPAKNDSLFHGKYCSVYIRADENLVGFLMSVMDVDTVLFGSLEFRTDVCLPNTCKQSDIEAALVSTLTKTFMGMIKVDLNVGVCKTRDYKKFTNIQKVAFGIFGFLGVFLIWGTVWDILLRLKAWRANEPSLTYHEGGAVEKRAMLCFSVYKNGENLLKTSVGNDSLGALNGIRTLSTVWILFMNSYYYLNHFLHGNLTELGKLKGEVWFQTVVNGAVSVDSFFMMSGLLMTYGTMKDFKRDGQINWFRRVLHRYWRLTPVYAVFLLVTFCYPQLASGPTYLDNKLYRTIENCDEKWWWNLLYISNFLDVKQTCWIHTWYLSVDMQCFVFAPVILIALYKMPIFGLILNFILLVASNAATGYIVYSQEYPAVVIHDQSFSNEKLNSYYQDVYIMTYCRLAPYCTGIFVGFFLSVSKNRKLNFSRWMKAAFWCLSIVGSSSVVFGSYEWNNGNPSSNEINALYASTKRSVWCLALSWVVIACSTKNAGIVNSILSWKFFVPLSKLTYVVYMIHPMLLMIYSDMIRERIIYTNYLHIIMFFGILTLSNGLGFFISLAVEVPFLELEKVLFPKRKVLKAPPIIVSDDCVNDLAKCANNRVFEAKP